MKDFSILKYFKVTLRPPRAPSIKEVLWQPPPIDWMKCNTDGAYNTVKASCGGVFSNRQSEFVFAFAENLDFHSSFVAELCGVMKAIEIANIHNWLNLWIETDSNLAVLAFKSNSLVPWMVKNRWKNCKLLARRMNLIITHIGNAAADSLANLGLNTDNVLFFWEPPNCIVTSLNRNKLGLPSRRFKSY
ncbi:hypothetical protein TSUD_410840 [Trifolium subterraneum]|uniref:RNase H type-1 domain-containing protein n=1 Tax=Trifolium subterraneum TaxID=3900 RepID=A0A2Z6P321_TRISU|nr:hypothetical protein TSUD_410840 [Trifolium subterraneum]